MVFKLFIIRTRMRILFVESDDFQRTFFVLKLRQALKCSIDSVKSNSRAIRLLKEDCPYDLIISGFDSENKEGFELSEFKARHSIPGIFVLHTSTKIVFDSSPENEFHIVERFSSESLIKFINEKF